MEHPDRAPDDRGLPDRGDGRRRLPGGPARPARRPIESVAIDTAEPSAFARGILTAQPYSVPRRRAARGAPHAGGDVAARRSTPGRPTSSATLDPDAIARVREEAWPQPRDAEEVHEALLWMGYVTVEEGRAVAARGSTSSRAAGRVVREGGPLVRRRGAARSEGGPARAPGGARPGARIPRLEPTIPCWRELEAEGAVLRTRIDGRQAWCDRRLLARIHRYTLDRLRARDRAGDGRAVPALPRLLAARRRRAPPRGPARRGRGACDQLAGFEVPARGLGGERPARARARLPARVARPADALGRGRLGAALGLGPRGRCAARRCALVPREDLEAWLALAALASPALARRRARRSRCRSRSPSAARCSIRSSLRASAAAAGAPRGGPGRADRARPRDLRLVRGPALADRAGVAAQRRRAVAGGRWSVAAPRERGRRRRRAEFVARQLLRGPASCSARRSTREKQPVPWRDIARACRPLEARGEVRGGRFVAGLRRRAVRAARGRDAAARRPQARRAGDASECLGRGPAELPRHPHARRARLPGDPDARRGRLTRPPISGGGGGAARAARGPGGPWCPARAPVRFPCRTRPSTRRRWSRWCR